MTDSFRQTWRYRSVVQNYIHLNFGLKYRRNALGYIWSVLLPLGRYLVMGLVFSLVLKSGNKEYFTSFFLGMIFFTYFSASWSTATASLVNNSHYIRRVFVPKIVFVISPIAFELINSGLVLTVAVIIGVSIGWVPLGWNLVLVLPGILLTTVFVFGLGMVTSVLMVWFNDTQYLVELTLQTLLWVTPVMYSREVLPSWLSSLNPIDCLLTVFRNPLLGVLPTHENYLVATLVSLSSLVVGTFVLTANQDRIVYRL